MLEWFDDSLFMPMTMDTTASLPIVAVYPVHIFPVQSYYNVPVVLYRANAVVSIVSRQRRSLQSTLRRVEPQSKMLVIIREPMREVLRLYRWMLERHPAPLVELAPDLRADERTVADVDHDVRRDRLARDGVVEEAQHLEVRRRAVVDREVLQHGDDDRVLVAQETDDVGRAAVQREVRDGAEFGKDLRHGAVGVRAGECELGR